MADEMKEQLDALEEAVLGVNEVNKNLEQIKKLHSQFDEKSKIAIEKVASADSKLDEMSKIKDEIVSLKSDFDKEYREINDIVQKTILPFKNDLLNTKNQLNVMQSTINSLKNSDGTTRVVQTKSPELEKEITQLKIENTELMNKLNQLDKYIKSKFVTEDVTNNNKQNNVRPVVVVKKHLNPKVIENVSSNNKQNNVRPVVVIKKRPNSEETENGLKEFFEARNCEVIDKRPNGGALWVVGDEKQLKPILDEMKTKFSGVSGAFAAGRATKQRRGWFTQDKR